MENVSIETKVAKLQELKSNIQGREIQKFHSKVFQTKVMVFDLKEGLLKICREYVIIVMQNYVLCYVQYVG